MGGAAFARGPSPGTALEPHPIPVQGDVADDRYAAFAQVVAVCEQYSLREKIEAETLGTQPGVRGWALNQLVLFHALPDAPRPAGYDITALAAQLAELPPHPDDPPGALATGALSGFQQACGVDPARALERVDALLEFPGIDDVAGAAILGRASDVALWQSGWRDAHRLSDRALAAHARWGTVDAPTHAQALARVHVYMAQARLEVIEGRPDFAARPFELAHDAARAAQVPDLWGQTVVGLLDLAHASDDKEGGARIHARATSEPLWQKVTEGSPWLARAVSWRADALALIGSEDRRAALDALEAYLSIDDASGRWQRQKGTLATYLIRAAVEAGDGKRARRVLTSPGVEALIQVEDRQALQALVTAAELGPGAASAEALEAAVRARLARLEVESQGAFGRGLLHFDADAQLLSMALRARRRSDGGDAAALRFVAEVQSAGALSAALGATITESDRFESLVPPQGGVLVLVPGLAVDHVFAFDADGIAVHEVERARTVHARRRALVRSIRRSSREESTHFTASVLAEAALLGRAVLGEAILDRIASWKRATVIGLRSYGELPVELLESKGRRLGSWLELSFAPSIPVALALRARREPATAAASIAALAVPSPRTGASRGLTALGTGQAALRRAIPGDLDAPLRTALDEDATGQRWRELLAPAPSIGVMIAHGARDQTARQCVVLSASENGLDLFTPDEARDVPAPPLVVLAACDAGRTMHLRGDDGGGGLAQSFLAGGGQVVVAPAVPVQLASALSVTRATVEHCVQDGGSPAAALRRARMAHPVEIGVWLTRAHGDGHAQLFAPEPSERAAFGPRVLAGLLGGLALATVLALRARKRSGS